MGYPSRIQQLRDFIVKEVPRVPNDRKSLMELESRSTINLILSFVTWRMRLIPQKPRRVTIWPRGVTRHELQVANSEFDNFLRKVIAGDDLDSHLSRGIETTGVVLQRSQPTNARKDIDSVLIRYGLHHFHFGSKSKNNPTGRSNKLVFAEVLEKEFRIVAISDHSALKHGTPQNRRLLQICHAYMAKYIQLGQAFMSNPVSSSGHSSSVHMFAIKCNETMQRMDLYLDDPSFIDKLYYEHDVRVNGHTVLRPNKPHLKWHFDDLKFGILDKSTTVFFCIYPFFSR